jgi:hypothetical protein
LGGSAIAGGSSILGGLLGKPKTTLPPGFGLGTRTLRDLLKQGTPDFPEAPVAGFTPTQMEALSQLSQFVSGQSFQDPSTSKLWEGLRAEIDRSEETGVTALRRRGQLAGMFRSSPSLRQEGDFRANIAGKRASILGGLFEAERARDNPLARAQAGLGLGAAEQSLEQQRQQSQFNAQMQELMFPFQTLAPLAASLRSPGPITTVPAAQTNPISDALMGSFAMMNLFGGQSNNRQNTALGSSPIVALQ